jgi:hypothetical protein
VLGVQEFYRDFTRLSEIVSSGPVKTFTYYRLRWLHSSFKMHRQLNSRREQDATEVRECDSLIYNLRMILAISRLLLKLIRISI